MFLLRGAHFICVTYLSCFYHSFLLYFRCVIEDGTGEAMVFIDDDEVLRQMLFVQESRWLELKNMTRKQGEIFYQRSAYWKVRTVNNTIMNKFRKIESSCNSKYE